MRVVTALLLVAALIALGGCGRKMTFTTKEGTTTVEQGGAGENKTVTVTSKEGSATFGKNAVDLAKLGLPVYPGATAKNTGGFSISGKTGSSETVMLETNDSFDKVYEWYKAKMPAGSETMKLSSGGGQFATFQVGKTSDKEVSAVTITGEKDKTSIMLTKGSKP